MTENIEDNNNGIVKRMVNGVEHTFWTHADVVRQYIKEDLKKRFPGKLIVRELNRIDLTIPEDNLPVEIQSTRTVGGGVHYSGWENEIRRQIEQDIIYSKCLFFFDSELLRAMKNAGKAMSINMDWFRKLMKEEKLRVFTISHDGIIEEKTYKDFDFLAEISQTCSIAAETDEMILNKNKMKVFAKIVKGYGFIQDEIDKFESDYEKYCKTNKIDNIDKNDHKSRFLVRQTNERAKLYGNILVAVGDLSAINLLLNKEFGNYQRKAKQNAKILGIFDAEGSTHKVITKFVDRFDICKYFPGYLRNKETWDKLRGLNLNTRQFANIMTGKNDVINGLDYYFNENNDTGNNVGQIMEDTNQNQIDNYKDISTKIDNKDQTDNDKEVNIKIDNKDHTININIKAKQKTIEDAWN